MIQYIGLALYGPPNLFYMSVINVAFCKQDLCPRYLHHAVTNTSSYTRDIFFHAMCRLLVKSTSISFYAAVLVTCFSGSPEVYVGASNRECVTFFDHDSAYFLSWSLAQLIVTSTNSFSPPSASAVKTLLPRPSPAKTDAISAIAFCFWALRAIPRSCLLRIGW